MKSTFMAQIASAKEDAAKLRKVMGPSANIAARMHSGAGAAQPSDELLSSILRSWSETSTANVIARLRKAFAASTPTDAGGAK